MARRCSECGEALVYRYGDHYRDTGKGRVLYTNVKQYTCPSGCRTAYYDYRRARPAGTPEKLFFLIPMPSKEINVVDPLLKGGLVVFAILLAAAFLVSTLHWGAKAAAVSIITLGVVLVLQIVGRDDNPPAQEPN